MEFSIESIRDRLAGISIRYRLMLYLLAGLIPIILVSLYFARLVYISRLQQVQLDLMATAQATAGTVTQFVRGISRSQEIVTLTIIRQNMTSDQMSEYFSLVTREIGVTESMAYALPTGRVVAAYPSEAIGFNVLRTPYFQEIVAGNSWTVSQLLTSLLADSPVFIVARRVDRDGEFAGVLFSHIDPMTLQTFVQFRAVQDVGYSILDPTGRIIVSTAVSPEFARTHPDRSYVPGVSDALAGEPVFVDPFTDPIDGIRKMGASVPVSDTGWVVDLLQPVSTAAAPVRRAAIANVLLIALITIAMLALIWIAGTRLAKPITLLARRAYDVAGGDFAQRMSVPDRAELGTLAEAFNTMTTELERFSAAERRLREQATFFADIGELLTATLDPNVAMRTVVEKTVDYMADVAALIELLPDGEAVLRVAHAKDPAVLEQFERQVAEYGFDLSKSVVGTAITAGETLFVPDIYALEDPNMRFYLEKADVISTIAVPMRVRGEVVGVLSLSSKTRHFTEQEVLIAEDLARRLGIALENIRLYEETLQRERFLTGLADLATAVSSSLDPSVVLGTICSRMLDLLDADGVYLWVINEEGDQLRGTSACGHKADQFIGERMPLSNENSGAVQAVIRRKAFYLHDMPYHALVGPVFTAKFDTHAALFQPLISGGEVLGVMVVTDIEDPERFNEETLEESELLAGYAATALANARAYTRERRIAETLQRSLLAEVPERIDHYELAYFYTPARREAAVGGDFYDFIDLGNGLYDLIIGDVSGKGLEAAVVTALAKYVLRAYTVNSAQPASVLASTNDAVYQYTASELFITMAYCLLDTTRGVISYASAGHEPLLLLRRDGSVEEMPPTGMAVGIIPGATYTESEFTLQPGDELIMYTDGLTDARSPDGEFLRLEGLLPIVRELAGRPAREFLEELVNRVKDYTGGEFSDDVAVLVTKAL